MATRKKKTTTRKRRRRTAGSLPGLDDQIGDATIERELGAAEEAERARASADEPPPPPPPPDGGIADLGTKSTGETAELIQGLYGAACGGVVAAPGGEDGKLPDVEAQLYARCLEVVVGDDTILTPRRALYVLVIGFGARLFFGVRAARSKAAAAAAAKEKKTA